MKRFRLPMAMLIGVSGLLSVWNGVGRAQDTAEPAPAAEVEAPAETAPAESVPTEPSQPLPPVAATVDGEPIFVGEVEATFQLTKKQGQLQRIKPEEFKAFVLEQLIERLLIVHGIKRDPDLVTDAELDQWYKANRDHAIKQGLTLEQLCAKMGITVNTLRNGAIFNFGLKRFIERDLADDLESYFKAHQAELDGTEIRASHIILQPTHYNESSSDVQKRAEKIREEIESGAISFADAAKKYSYGPSREKGGDLGFIPRHGLMLEPFSEALYKLKVGEISPPVTTPAGVHLIQATEVKPGDLQWTQVIPQIRQVAAREKLKALVDAERERSKIEYTGTVPHYEPGTKTLAKAASE